MKDNSMESMLEIAISQNDIPRHLYKYRSINQLLMLLENNNLYFAKPNEFNDPFDCQIVPETEYTLEEIKDYLRTSEPGISAAEVDFLALSAFQSGDVFSNNIKSVFDNILNNTGICCFSTDNKNLLLWSHYGDYHKGVCVKFDLLQDLSFFITPFEVNYREDYPKYNHLKNQNNLLNDMVLSKSIHWKYEDEFRVVKPSKNGLISFNKKALVEITFGCKAAADDIDKVKHLLTAKGYSTNLDKVIKKKGEFALEIHPL